MNDTSYESRLIGAQIMSTAYGTGHVTRFALRDDNKFYISILFDSDNDEKTFMASMAFSKRVLVFAEDELNRTVNLLLQRHEMRLNDELSNTEENEHNRYSQNESINELIIKVLKGEQIAVDLISYFDDAPFERDLCEEAFYQLERIMAGVSIETAQKASIVCALSLIAQKYYDGDLHSYIERKFREYRPMTENKYSRTVIQSGIYRAIGGFRKRVKYFDSKSYVAVPLVMCCVPHYRVKDLFRIAYDIYKQKLLFDEDLADGQIEDKVLETFETLRRKDLISDSDTIKGTNYLMSKYTQSCIYSGYGIDTLTKIVTHCIRLIIDYLSKPEDSFVVDPYYSEGYTVWRSAFEADEKEKTKYEANRTISQPQLKLVHTAVHLFTGEFSMDESCNPNNVHICIYQGDSLVEDRLITDTSAIEFAGDDSAISGYIIRRQEIPLSESPLGELSYTIECDGQKLYDSKARLYRSAVFFDGKGNEVKPGTNYSGDIFALTYKSLKEEYGDRVREEHHGNGYTLSVIEVNAQEVFHFNGEPFIFYKVSSAELISYAIPWGEFITVEGKPYPIYNDITILFPSLGDREDVCLEVDGQKYYYGDGSDLDFSVRIFSKEHGDTWVYTLKVFNLEAGFHSIRVFNALSGKQIKGAHFNILYDPDMWKGFVSKDSRGIYYNISGSFVESQDILYEYGTTRKEHHSFVKNLGHGSLVIYPSSISYSVDGKAWHDIDEKIYLCEIPESIKTIQICGPEKMTAYYIDNDASVKKQQITLEGDASSPSLYRLHLSLLRTITGRKSARVSFEYGNRTKYVNIWYNPLVLREECRFYYDDANKVHTFEIHYEGSSTIRVVIKGLHSDSVIASKEISSGELITVSPDTIDESIQFLSVSLHGKKYGALFDKYQSEPFMSFPKYDLGRTFVKLTEFPPRITVAKGIMRAKIMFEGATTIKAEIVPNGFSKPVLSNEVENGGSITVDISALPFNAYKLNLYQKSMHAENGVEYIAKPFFTSKTIRVESPFLNRTFTVSAFVLTDGTQVKANYSVRFFTIAEINNRYYLCASLMNKANGSLMKDVLVSVKKVTGFQFVVGIRQRVGDSLARFKLNSGKVIEGAVVEKVGGWV